MSRELYHIITLPTLTTKQAFSPLLWLENTFHKHKDAVPYVTNRELRFFVFPHRFGIEIPQPLNNLYLIIIV